MNEETRKQDSEPGQAERAGIGILTSSPTARRQLIEAVVASTVGTSIEWYDFFLYGTAAATVFPELFFPGSDQFLSQIKSLGTFAVGFVARPVGGIIFGYLGDRIGRKSTLVTTLLLMGISTVLVGFVPTYSMIGGMAPLILILLRFIQGVGVGGEWGGAVLLAVEYGHRGKRGFYASWPQTGVPLGLVSSTGIFFIFRHILTEEAFHSWGWRVPFLLSGILIGVGLLIRIRILETPLFEKLRAQNQLAKAPVGETLRHHWREVLLAAGCRIGEQSCFYLFSIFVIDYAKDALGVEEGFVLLVVSLAALVEVFTMPFFGFLSDIFSRKSIYILGCLFLAWFAVPYFAMLESRETAWIVWAVLGSIAIGHAMLYSVQASLIPELFGTRVRYTGASLGYQLASVVAGGPAPLIALTLVKNFPGRYWPLAAYIMIVCLISLVCVQLLAETSRKDIEKE